MFDTTDTLQLDYVFTPDPQPIYASAAGANPNIVAINVMVSNPSMSAVTLKKITIEIPVGQELAADLSTQNLPIPTSKSTLCQVVSGGNTITISPPSDSETMTLAGIPILFALPKIQVNEMPGNVPITITEFPVSGPKQTDSSQSLVKQPTNSIVTNFYASPSLLYNLDTTTTLYWACTDAGKNYSYSVRTDDYRWQPKDCLDDGICYGVQDGIKGVPTAALQQDGVTTFALDVISTDSNGERSVIATLTTTVQVTMPSIAANSYQSVSPSGQMVRLHWLALNAAYCTVTLDSKVIDTNAPIDTYRLGYTVVTPGVVGTVHQLTVNAYSQSGAQAFLPFSEITLTSPPPIPVGSIPDSIAITPDGTLALVVNTADNTVTVLDLASLTAESHAIPVGHFPYGIAITPDSALALVANTYDNTVTVIDIAGRAPEAQGIPTGIGPYGIAITPDGRYALVQNLGDQTVTVIDIAGRASEPSVIPIGSGYGAVAITPDGTLAFVTNGFDNTVSVIDIANRSPKINALPVGNEPAPMAITSDGALALVAHWLGDTVTVIDIASLTPEPTAISVNPSPLGIAVTPDSTLALVTNSSGNSVSILDIAARTAETRTISVGAAPTGIAISTADALALVVNTNDGTVSVI